MDEQLPDSDGVLPNKLGITDPEELKTARSEPSTYPRATPHSAGQPSLVPRNTDSSTSYVTNASCASDLNAIHPFRDGRAIRIFLQQLAANAGYDLAYRDADEESLMMADIAASDGNCEQLESLYASIHHPRSDHS